MPAFRSHLRFNLLFALPIWALGVHLLWAPELKYLLTFCAAFFYASFFFHPDLDLAHQVKLFSWRGFLTLPFRFYSLFFRHRGVSHHWLWGTLSRLAWIYGCFLLLFYFSSFPSFRSQDLTFFLWSYKPYFLFGLGGIFLSDLSHLGLDLLHKK